MLYSYRTACVLIAFFLALGTQAVAQTEPDTVRRKNTLPTGPPAPPQQQPPRVLEQRPPAQPSQEVVTEQQVLEERVPLLDRLYWGGGFGLQFGRFTNITLSPIVGYKATEKFWIGGGIVYHFISSSGNTLQNYGGKAFMQHEVFDNFLIHAEYEALSVEVPAVSNGRYVTFREQVNMPMAGLGYRQRIGARASADLLVLYNFSDHRYTPYSNPVIRAGFNIPFRR